MRNQSNHLTHMAHERSQPWQLRKYITSVDSLQCPSRGRKRELFWHFGRWWLWPMLFLRLSGFLHTRKNDLSLDTNIGVMFRISFLLSFLFWSLERGNTSLSSFARFSLYTWHKFWFQLTLNFSSREFYWDITPCSRLRVSRLFEGTYRLHF
jgi:hypothetical protein